MAAVVTTAEIADRFANGMEFFSSFGGNPVSCAVGTAVLEVIHNEQLQSNAQEVGAYFKKRLKDVQAQYPGVGDVRGEGLFLGIEFITAEQIPDPVAASFVMNQLKERFILTGIDGPHQNVIKIKPPLCFTVMNVDTFIEAMESILEQYDKSV
jgi:4-aminobutyrate aminotransferase-like enzyme